MAAAAAEAEVAAALANTNAFVVAFNKLLAILLEVIVKRSVLVGCQALCVGWLTVCVRLLAFVSRCLSVALESSCRAHPFFLDSVPLFIVQRPFTLRCKRPSSFIRKRLTIRTTPVRPFTKSLAT